MACSSDGGSGPTREEGGLFTRRQAVIGAGLAGLSASVPMGALAAGIKRQGGKPNIIFIVADDLGYADLSCYGRRDYQTPEIDRLAAEGIRFTHAYANSAVCSATRTAIMTGRYQYRLPIGLEEPLAGRDIGLPPFHPTLASQLRAAGYSTSLIGKWHLGQLPKYGPALSGYDHFWGVRGGGVDYFTHGIADKPDLWDGDQPVKETGYLTTLLGDRAVAMIEDLEPDHPPFFLSLHFTAPHWPWEGPNDQAEANRLQQKGTPAALYHFDGGSLEVYGEIVAELDRQVGRVVAALEKTGEASNTIVIFTSDNGGERFSDTWPFSGKKTELLEGGIRVPAIVRWPAKVPAGKESEQVVASMDWMPTLLAAGGGEFDKRYPPDGIDLSEALSGAPPKPRTLFWRYHNMSQEACRRENWKYLKIAGNSFLFDIVADPLERANLKDREPEIYRSLVEAYAAWNATMLPIDPNGYTSGRTGAEMADHFGVTHSPMVID